MSMCDLLPSFRRLAAGARAIAYVAEQSCGTGDRRDPDVAEALASFGSGSKVKAVASFRANGACADVAAKRSVHHARPARCSPPSVRSGSTPR